MRRIFKEYDALDIIKINETSLFYWILPNRLLVEKLYLSKGKNYEKILSTITN